MLSHTSNDSPSPRQQIPSIRLLSATPSAAGISSEANTSFSNSFDSSWASISPVPLAPKSDAPIRKRLVPKKSKLSILGASNKEIKREKDLSDIVRQVGADTSSARGEFEIYVDPSNDPELEDIVVVKKKKSRAALDGMSWGSLGEVTNVPAAARRAPISSDNLLKVKNDEEKKWWSIGRGRRDSKEKEKECKENPKRAKSPEMSMRSKTPDPLNQEGRARFNSLDSGILLNTPINMGFPNRKTSTSSEQQCPSKSTRSFTPESLKEACQDIESLPPLPPSRSTTPTPTLNGFLAPPTTAGKEQGSIALRAIRSVKSLARIGSRAPTASSESKDGTIKEKRDKKEKKERKEKKEKKDSTIREKKKHKKEKKEKESEGIPRHSSSSFETEKPDTTPKPLKSQKSQTLGKKLSILGLGIGLPGSMRLPSARSGSTSSSILLQPNKLPVEELGTRPPKERMGSTMSTSSSVRPPKERMGSTVSTSSVRPPKERMGSIMSTASSVRPMSTASSSGASAFTRDSKGSVRWDEAVLRDGKREMQKEKKQKQKKAKEEGKESRRSNDGRKRTLITDVFPDIASSQGNGHLEEDEYEHEELRKRYSTAFPIVTIEEATADGHDTTDIHDSVVYGGIATKVEEIEEQRPSPVKRQRVRPMSEQLRGKSRPRPMHEDDEGVLSILDAATNDLALLINHLDLEATPSTPDMTPLKPLSANILDSARSDFNLDGTLSQKSRLALGGESPLKYKSPPSHVNNSPLRKSVKLRASVASITSLRPYAQSRGNATKTLSTPVYSAPLGKATTLKNRSSESTIGQPISPWPLLIQQLSPLKEHKAPKDHGKENIHSQAVSPVGTWKKGHKRSMTPGPEPDPAPVFHALKPPKPRPVQAPEIWDGKATLRASSSTFFAPVNVSKANATKGSFSPPASLGRRASAFLKKRFSLLPVPAESSGGEDLSFQCAGINSRTASKEDLSFQCAGSNSPPLSGSNSNSSSEKKRRYLPATLGGSDVSCYRVPELDTSDPDSDIPDELQFILKNGDYAEEDDTFNFNRRVSGSDQDYDTSVELPRTANPDSPITFNDIAAPVFCAALTTVGSDMEEIDDGDHGDAESDVDTKQSFDFTGELQKLNESGASDRRSFVEQLEKAFRTPAKVDLRCDFGTLLSFEVPPVPKMPSEFNLNKKYSTLSESKDVSTDADEEILSGMTDSGPMAEDEPEAFDMYEVTRLMDVKKPTSNIQSIKYEENTQTQESRPCFNLDSVSNIVDAPEPSLLFPWSKEEDSAEGPSRVIVSNDPSYDLDNTFSSTHSRSNSGELNTSFKFGGRPRSENKKGSTGIKEQLTLSDIIPSPEHVRSLSAGSLEDDSVMKSIIAIAKSAQDPQPRSRVMSDASDMFLQPSKSEFRHSHASSISSFTGFDSFEAVRRGFEFHPNKPQFYPAPIPAARRGRHSIRDSFLSIASVSSYGRVINPGVPDPFDFGLPSLQERPSSEALSSSSYSVDDTFSFLNHASRRRRVDSDASSYYFHASAPRPNHHRQDSNVSISSQNPPTNIYNRGLRAHRRNSSNSSIISRSARRRSGHRYNDSVDSIMSDFSAIRLGRPGIGDRMFEMADHLKPLASISASPESGTGSPANFTQQMTYDSIMDDDRVFSMSSDSLFDKSEPRTTFDDRVFSTGSDSIFDKTQHRTSMMSEDSVFGCDDDSRIQPGLLPLHHFRPLSMMSMSSVHPPPNEDDTMISMLGGGHVRRCSIGSVIQASPCARRVEKRKHQKTTDREEYELPSKTRIVERPSIGSTLQFGSDRIIKVQQGLLERQSLDDAALSRDVKDTSSSFRASPVFTRPAPTTRSRSSTCTSSSGGDTPPLSASDGASISGSSLSSIDLSELNHMLSNVTHPASTLQQARARARGDGHRRRYSHVRNSRAESVYETIDEEDLSGFANSPAQSSKNTNASSPTPSQQVFIVDGDTASIHSAFEESTASIWEDERGVAALRKFYALRDEAQNTVVESKRTWSDTPFSLFAIQSFQPPQHPEGMQALLQHSVQNYRPLPSELRPRQCRSRKNSRPSPYPYNRPVKVSASPETIRMVPFVQEEVPPRLLANHQALATKSTNIPASTQTLGSVKQFLPMTFSIESNKNAVNLNAKENQNATVRPRVASSSRRSALGWTKRSTQAGPKGSTNASNIGKMSTDSNPMSRNQKENVSMGSIISPGETLRINRPRPKGRTTSATKAAPRPIRI